MNNDDLPKINLNLQ